MKHWLFNCREVSERFSQSMDRRAPRRERLLIRAHQLMCRHCARLRRQLLLLRRLARWEPAAGAAEGADVSLSPEARRRIKKILLT